MLRFLVCFLLIELAIVAPVYMHGDDLSKIINAWEEWQTFIAALIALNASVIALWASECREEKTRQRELNASKVLLVLAFEDISSCLNENMKLYEKAFSLLKDSDLLEKKDIKSNNIALINPASFSKLSIFLKHIHPEKEAKLDKYIKNIFRVAHICEMRTISDFNSNHEKYNYVELVTESSILSTVLYLCYTDAVMRNIFLYATGEKGFDGSIPTVEDISSSLRGMKADHSFPGIYEYLQKYTGDDVDDRDSIRLRK